MSSTTMVTSGDAFGTHTRLGWKFIHSGLGLFVTGFVTGFVPIAHYMHGAIAGDVGPAFLKNMTLWWGCPAVLAELTLKAGGLGMIAIGLCYLAAARQSASSAISTHERIAPTLCSYGLIAELVTAGVGYALFNYFWPNFFFEPVQAGKNLWLGLQGISIAVFVVGLFYAMAGCAGHRANSHEAGARLLARCIPSIATSTRHELVVARRALTSGGLVDRHPGTGILGVLGHADDLSLRESAFGSVAKAIVVDYLRREHPGGTRSGTANTNHAALVCGTTEI